MKVLRFIWTILLNLRKRALLHKKEQSLFLGHLDGDLIKDKRVLIVDDVILTGESLKAVIGLVNAFGENIVASCGTSCRG